MEKPCTKRILSWNRQKFYERLKQSGDGVSAAIIYDMLDDMDTEKLKELAAEFYTDDHCYWPKQEEIRAGQTMTPAQKKWNQIARQTKQQQERRGEEPGEGESLFAAQVAAERGRRSYREFLQKFAVLREELHADPEEFDLNYYTYGLHIYGNMPLIEPLESRETKKIHEFVIAIDTSYSTNGKLVEQFLRETVDILNQSDHFFEDARIRILQCDNEVRRDTLICGQAQWAGFLKDFELIGGGGTDFRSAFTYVNELIEQGEIKNCPECCILQMERALIRKRDRIIRWRFCFWNRLRNSWCRRGQCACGSRRWIRKNELQLKIEIIIILVAECKKRRGR